MCSITKLMCLMLALHRVQSEEGAVSDFKDHQNDDGLSTTLEPSSTVTVQSEKTGSTSENIASTEETVTADNTQTTQVFLERTEDSKKRTVPIELDKTATQVPNVNVSEDKPSDSKSLELGRTANDNSFQSTVSQKTISDDVSANIEVGEQKTKQLPNENNSEDKTSVSKSLELGRNANDNSFQSTVSQKTISDDVSANIEVGEQKIKEFPNKNNSEDKPSVNKSLELDKTAGDNIYQSTLSQKTISDDVSANIEVGEQKAKQVSNKNDSENKSTTSKSLKLGKTANDNSVQSTVSQKTISDDVSENVKVKEQKVSTENISEDLNKTSVSKILERDETLINNNFQSPANQKTTSDNVLANIEVEEQKTQQVSTENDAENIPPVSNLLRMSLDNESPVRLSSTSHPELNDEEIVTIKTSVTNDDEIKKVTKKSSGEEPVEITSAKEESGFEHTFESDTADLFNSSFTRRMLGGFVLDSSGKSSMNALPTVVSEVNSLPTDNNETKSVPAVNDAAKSVPAVNSEANKSIPAVNSEANKSGPKLNSEAIIVTSFNSEAKRVLTVNNESKSTSTINSEAKIIPTAMSEVKSVPIVNSEVRSKPTDNNEPNSKTIYLETRRVLTVNSDAKILPTVKNEVKSVSTVNSEPKSLPTVNNNEDINIPQANSEAKRVPTVHSPVKVEVEPTRRKSHKGKQLPPASTALPSTLPSESHRQAQNWNEPKRDDIPTTASPEVLVPLFRSLRPTSPTLVQIQPPPPYQPALDQKFTKPPIPYNQYANNPIFQKLKQATEELRHNMAQINADSHRWHQKN